MARSIRRLSTIAGVALAGTTLFLANAAPASALLGTNLAVTITCGYSQTCDGVGQAVPIGTGSTNVAITCTAVTPYVVQATGVGCYLLGDFYGDRHYAPTQFTQGQTSSTTATFTGLVAQSYRLCIGAGLITSSGTPRAVTGYQCFYPL